jgi:predicted nucleic acid-binding protein
MTGIDANVLVALAIGRHPKHSQAVEVFDRELAADEQIVLSSGIAAEFLHVVTDAKRVAPVREMKEAIEWLRTWNKEIEPIWLSSNESVNQLWLQWMEEFHLGRKRILDTHYAALLHANGVARLLTSDVEDFRVFGVFDIVTF